MRTQTWLLACAIAAQAAFAATNCNDLTKLALPQTEIRTAELNAAGTFKPLHGKPIAELPNFCRVAAVSKPSTDSNIEFEVWMPATGWNGKFQGVGNGGFAGEISYEGMANAIAHGYATASTDTGHEASGIDASWALRHPEKIIDYGHRAIHVTALNAKAMIEAFYGSAPKRSYFNSCSNGGRQALMEAQRYPTDYDGIIAGAPANYWTHLLSNAAWDNQALLARQESYIPASKLSAIESAALAACDAADGVKDGVIEDPPRCHFDPAVLECKGAESDACLTTPQIETLKKLYSGGKTSGGKSVFPGYSPGGEAEPGGWALWITGSEPEKSLMFAFGTQFFKNMVFDNSSWDFRTFDVNRDTVAADQKMASVLNANDPDLSAFNKRGGKLILYHGWSDAAIAARATINYYGRVMDKMGADTTARFVRLFMVPGMEHCGGGAAPDDFGEQGVAEGDPNHNISTALEHWVEGGPAPETLIAAKRDQNGKVARTRPLCAYPAIAQYKGSGSTDDAANFACVPASAVH